VTAVAQKAVASLAHLCEAAAQSRLQALRGERSSTSVEIHVPTFHASNTAPHRAVIGQILSRQATPLRKSFIKIRLFSQCRDENDVFPLTQNREQRCAP
jgi:hypothetical protein